MILEESKLSLSQLSINNILDHLASHQSSVLRIQAENHKRPELLSKRIQCKSLYSLF